MARNCRTNTYHHCNLRQTLIDNCLKLIEDKGVSGFTLREIARMSGVSPAAPYHHFKNKTELLAAVAVMGFKMLDEAQQQAIDESDNTGCKLTALGKSYVMFAVNHKVYFHVMFRVNNELLWENPQVMIAAKQTFRHLENTIRELYPEAGEGNGNHLRAAVISRWSMVHGIASLWIDGPLRLLESGKPNIEELVDLVFGQPMIHRGI